MAAAIPAVLAGAIEIAPMVISGITSAAAAADLFKKYAPSRKTLNSAMSNINRKSVGKFFKGLTSAKGIGRLFDQGSELASTVANISQDASSVLTNLERAGISNEYTKQAMKVLNTTGSAASSINDMMGPVRRKVKAMIPEDPIPIPALPAPEYSAPAPIVPKKKKKKAKKIEYIPEYVPPAPIPTTRPSKKKTKKNKIITTINERSRTYR